MAIINREMFLENMAAICEQECELVEIAPGMEVKVIQLSAEEAFGLVKKEGADMDEKETQRNSFSWIALSCRDAEGNPVFSVDDLYKLPFPLVQKLTQAVNKVNGVASAQNIEEAEKN